MGAGPETHTNAHQRDGERSRGWRQPNESKMRCRRSRGRETKMEREGDERQRWRQNDVETEMRENQRMSMRNLGLYRDERESENE